MPSTILATFDELEDAHSAVRDLIDNGFNRGDIGLAVYDADKAAMVDEMDDGDAAEGAGIGASFGAILGGITGLAAITIPGIGPVIAAGPLAALLGALTGAGIGAASGAVTGGIVGALVDMGVPEDDAHYYAESLRRGAALVSVTVHDANANRAMDILRSHNPIDIDTRVSQWRSEGWSRYDPSTEGYRAEPLAERDRERYEETPGSVRRY